MHLKMVLLSVSICLSGCLAPPVMAADSTAPGSTVGTTPTEASSDAAASAQGEVEELSLNDLQDLGIVLRLIRQQAINMYQEASRTSVKPNSGPDLPDFHSIPVHSPPDAGKLLPARQEWLVFYLATMEPQIRQLNKQVSDIQAGNKQLVIPPALAKAVNPLWESWQKNVQKMNNDLDTLVPLFDDAPHNNTKIEAVAVSLYNDTEHLDGIRKQVFHTVRQGLKSGADRIQISPP